MALHPEVSEKSIIQGGIELEKLGKSPNPGSIRAHLGYRGGLMRIKSVWDSFTQKRNQELLPERSTESSFQISKNSITTFRVNCLQISLYQD